MKKRLSILLAAVVAVLLLLPACDDEDCPTCPGDNPEPTMANIWPHADGNTWIYESERVQYEADGPAHELPTMVALYADLATAAAGDPMDTLTGLFRLELDGQVTTLSGVTAQHLSETWYLAPDYSDIEKQEPAAGSASTRLLRLIARARPDLREAVEGHLKSAAKGFQDIPGPVLCGGYAYAYEDSGYYGYGDLDMVHSWVYLESGLEVGTEFSMQLIPALADDVWLHARIWSVSDLTVGGQDFQNVVECMYVIDLGETVRTDEGGGVIDTVRSYEYGTVHYAPGVGPIRVRERGQLASSTAYGSDEDHVVDYSLELVGATRGD